jgi:C1A family cysteine protease
MPYRKHVEKKETIPQSLPDPPIINRKYGWIKKERNVSHHIFSVSKTQSAITKVDLRPFCPPVYDQLTLGSCFNAQTEVLTEHGWCLFSELSGTERLATVNPETTELIYEMPTRLISFDYDGDLIIGKNSTSLDFAVTPDHKMLVRKWNQSKRTLNDHYEFVPAKDLGWYCGLMNRIVWNGEGASDKYILPGVPTHKRKIQRVDKEVPMNIWLRFLGIYLAEGCFCLDPGHYKIQLAAVKEREKQFIQEVLSGLDLNYLELFDRFIFDNRQIYEELIRLGLKQVHAPYKFVPPFVFKQTASNIKEFLLGHFMGDGCEQRNKSHYTSSERLATDLQLLIFLSGNESYIGIREPRTSTMKDGRVVKGKFPEHRVSVCENKNLSIDRKNNITRTPYSGKVYCAEVPTYHTLITRHNRRILVSGNCTSNAIAAAYEFDEIKQKESVDFRPSRLFIYWGERSKEGTITEDAGADISDGINFINTVGVCPESIPENNTVGITKDVCWEYDISKFAQKPPDACITFASKHKSVNARAVQQSLGQLKQALIDGYPVTVGVMLYPSFESADVTRTGLVPMPSALDRAKGMIGGHGILIVGFDDNMMVYGEKGAFLLRNSWSDRWGLGGYFYLSYKYILDPNLSSDFWTITKISDRY